jgi:hypothetical protein
MGQMGFYDLERRLDALSAKGDPLEPIKRIVPWEPSGGRLSARPASSPRTQSVTRAASHSTRC